MGVKLLFPTSDNTWEQRTTEDFNPDKPVDIRITPADTTSGAYTLFLSGPPRLITRPEYGNANADIDLVLYPFAYTDNLGIGANKNQTRIFGLGSTESLTVGGPSIGSISFGRIIANMESLLAVAYKYYFVNKAEAHQKGFYYKPWLMPDDYDSTDTSVDPQNFETQGDPSRPAGRVLLGLHQKVFNWPVGFAVLTYDQKNDLITAFYIEEAIIRAHSIQISTATIIEQGSFEFTRMVPFPEGENINPFDYRTTFQIP